jgi:hypothetical protein
MYPLHVHNYHLSMKNKTARRWWLTAIILATQEAETRRIVVRSQPGQTVQETLSRKYLSPTQKRIGEVAKWPSKRESLSSNCRTTKKKTLKKQRKASFQTTQMWKLSCHGMWGVGTLTRFSSGAQQNSSTLFVG